MHVNPAEYRQKCIDAKGEECSICGGSEQVEVHHIDGDHENNDLENLVPLCGDCHLEVHHSDGGGCDEIQKYRSKLPEGQKSGGGQSGPPTVSAYLTIKKDQKRWADENHIHLSSLLREAIDERRE